MFILPNLVPKLIIILICSELISPINYANYRIIGGKTTEIKNFKYIVSLRRRNGDFFCAGSLVRSRYIVTAAHCVKGLKPSDFYVHGGVTYLTQKGVKGYIRKIFIPKTFNMKTANMDVAVLKLRKPLKGKSIATIPLCSRNLKTNNWVTISGWGFTSERNYKPSKQLRSVNVRIQSKSKCRRNYRGKLKVTSNMVCASVPGRRDACSGDSGGPLVFGKQLCGIVSLGIGCGRKKYPGIYTLIRGKEVWRFIISSLRK